MGVGRPWYDAYHGGGRQRGGGPASGDMVAGGYSVAGSTCWQPPATAWLLGGAGGEPERPGRSWAIFEECHRPATPRGPGYN